MSEFGKRDNDHWKEDVSFKTKLQVPRESDGTFGFEIETKARGNFVSRVVMESMAELSGLRVGQRILTCNDVDVRVADASNPLRSMMDSATGYLDLEVADGKPWGYRVISHDVVPAKDVEDQRLAALTLRVMELRRRTAELVDKRKKSKKKRRSEGRIPTSSA